MRINTRIVLDIATYAVLERESFEYNGPIAHCCGGGGGGGGESAAGAAGFGTGTPGGPEAGYGGSAGIAGMGTGGIGAAGVGAPGGPGAGYGGMGGADSGVSFSTTGAQIGATIGSIAGPVGAALGGVIGGFAGSAASGAGVGEGEGTFGGHSVGGEGDITGKQRAKAGVAKKTMTADQDTGSLKDVSKDAQEDIEKKARKRPQTILTSPLGLRSRPSIRRATLLGG